MSQTTQTSSGIRFSGMLFLLFLGLKLGNVIDWSWWWVTSPLWLPVGVVVAILPIILIAGLIVGALER